MSERYASWSTADHESAMQPPTVQMLGAAAGGDAAGLAAPDLSVKRAHRSIDLLTVLDGPLALAKMPGSGAEQAPEVLSLLTAAGLRAVHQSSPPGVAVFCDSTPAVPIDQLSVEHALLWLMCALDPAHGALEDHYASAVRRPLLCRRFAARLQALRPRAALEDALQPLLKAEPATEEEMEGIVYRTVRAVAEAASASIHQLEREWGRLGSTHSSLANACLVRFCTATGVHMQDATLMVSPQPARVRMLLLFYDRIVHEAQQWPRPYAWMPCLHRAIVARSADTLGSAMVERLWEELRAGGFWPSSALRDQLRPHLEGWMRSLFMTHGGIPLRAALLPKDSVCLYLHGTAGEGCHVGRRDGVAA